jgi:iron(II)-dependent oxidoreductase
MVHRVSSAPDQVARKRQLRDALERSREKTLWLLSKVSDEFLKVRVHSFYSPVGWHFGHVGRTEEYWIAHKAFGRPVVDDHLSFLFADLPDNPKDNRVHLPSREQIVEYLARTRTLTLDLLDQAEFDPTSPFLRDGYAWDFAVQHECQHQETICELLQLIQKQQDHPPFQAAEWHQPKETEMVQIPRGTFTMGSDAHCSYDNEKREHAVQVDAFKLDKTPVTAAQWLRFMNDGGYQRQELWTADGWAWRCTEDAEMPEYWVRTAGGFAYIGPNGIRQIEPDEPVSSISWFEADAYARWAGKRLPSEEEWEYAARFDPHTQSCRFYPWGDEQPNSRTAVSGISTWGPQPVGSKPCGQSATGCLDMAGNVWEWTSSRFLAYPGFEAFPYDGYSSDHMKGEHYCCRGGSWATAAPILRCSFRNWYVPTYRQGFLGLRCAR